MKRHTAILSWSVILAFFLLMPVLVMFAMTAHAQPVDGAQRIAHMDAECRSVMSRGVCIVYNRDPMPDELRSVPMRLGYGLGVVPTGAFIDIQVAGQQMCELIKPSCTSAWDGDQCKVIRSLWRQE